MPVSNNENTPSKNLYTNEERHELAQMARGLRRVKRQLLLMEAGEPQSPRNSVLGLRELLVKAVSPPPSPSRERNVRLSSIPFDFTLARSNSFDSSTRTASELAGA